MKVSKGQSQPEIVAAAFLLLYMVPGSPCLYHLRLLRLFGPSKWVVFKGPHWRSGVFGGPGTLKGHEP